MFFWWYSITATSRSSTRELMSLWFHDARISTLAANRT